MNRDRSRRRKAFAVILILAWVGLCVRLSRHADSASPAASNVEQIDFAKQVVPVLQSSCISCHANGLSKGGFRLDTRELMLKGGDSGEHAVVPGHSKDSPLIQLVTETDPTVLMPKKGPHLTSAQIEILRKWIDQGANWPAGVEPGRFKEADLAPRRPTLPVAAPGSGLTNSIDLILQPYFAANHFDPAGKVVDDRLFARRVYLDTIGLLPTPDAVEEFVKDASPQKREQLVRTLLADDRRYAEHWLSFWNDLLRNDYQGAGYIDGGRKQITTWLFNALRYNMRYDRFVRELVTGNGGAAGFTKGIVWRGTVNASQVPPMQAAQNVSQVFMGVNLKCASCHDSFVSNWKLTDSYGLAGIYADGDLEMQRCDHPLGKVAPLKFLYPQLGQVDPRANRAQRVAQLAKIMTDSGNGRLTRTIVNRLWQKTMGRGLIEPTDEMDNPPWNADLLDQLAVELSDQDFDLKKTLFSILTSRAYQMSAVVQESELSGDGFVFKGPQVRRMSAEQFTDAVSTVTGVWPDHAAVKPSQIGATTAMEVRSSLCPANPLSTALGRPGREQVMTERATAATTLQALELTNGSTLATSLHDASAKLFAKPPASADELVTSIYRRALGRDPSPVELTSARAVVGSPPTAEGTEDLMWAVFMLPEFQLIR